MDGWDGYFWALVGIEHLLVLISEIIGIEHLLVLISKIIGIKHFLVLVSEIMQKHTLFGLLAASI